MKRIRYSKYVPDPAGEMSMEDLLGALSDYLLQSGFENYMYDAFPDGEQTLDDLRRAIEQALMQGDMLSEEMREQLQQMQMDGTLEQLIEQLIERMEQENYISIDRSARSFAAAEHGRAGRGGAAAGKFEITDKSLDFLGYKTLRDLMGSLGKSSFGRHDTRDMATGIETSGSSRTYEFGDTLNLDITATLSSAIRARGLEPAVEYRVFRFAGASVRVPVFLRDGVDAGLLALDDSVWRRPLHPGEESGHGAVTVDSHAISGRFAVADSVS